MNNDNHMPSKRDQYSLFDLPRVEETAKPEPNKVAKATKPGVSNEVRFRDYDLTKDNCTEETWEVLGGDLPPVADEDLPFK